MRISDWSSDVCSSDLFGRSSFGRGRINFSRNRLFSSNRRVVVAARIGRHSGKAFRSAPLSAHMSYLKRDGVTRDGEKAVMFDASSDRADRSEEHTSELQSLMRISYAVFCLKKKTKTERTNKNLYRKRQ